jgi:hypothetical protein
LDLHKVREYYSTGQALASKDFMQQFFTGLALTLVLFKLPFDSEIEGDDQIKLQAALQY